MCACVANAGGVRVGRVVVCVGEVVAVRPEWLTTGWTWMCGTACAWFTDVAGAVTVIRSVRVMAAEVVVAVPLPDRPPGRNKRATTTPTRASSAANTTMFKARRSGLLGSNSDPIANPIPPSASARTRAQS